MNEGILILLTIVVAVGGAVALMIAAMKNRRLLREMEHRERLAMIERGLIPSPELDPARFEAATGTAARLPAAARGERYRTAGIGMIGLGLALTFLIGFTLDGAVAVGVGGAWVMLGLALLANYFLMNQRHADPGPAAWTPPHVPAERVEPPANVAP